MSSETAYTETSAQFAELCDTVISTREPVVIHRRGSEDVALLPAAELRSLMETAHLLRSPRNVQRLLTALTRAQNPDLPSESLDELRREYGLDQET